ncbi:hypothetical protein AB9F29_06250 [Falsihalocynthiibacter sp. S25ZX9]|uniref:hypothetical protein n=1 Tax=Falsihalocynthiibacter sp. S25ZX9 TaxID=3240870 RepID=UPI00350FBEB4
MIGPLIFASIVAGLAAVAALLNGSTLLGAFIVYSGTGAVTVLCVALLMYTLPRLRRFFGLQND